MALWVASPWLVCAGGEGQVGMMGRAGAKRNKGGSDFGQSTVREGWSLGQPGAGCL
jgi:hypothetical protein